MTIEIGREMIWRRLVSNYGHTADYRVTVRKIGKRITIEVPLKNGRTRKAIVRPERLHEFSMKNLTNPLA